MTPSKNLEALIIANQTLKMAMNDLLTAMPERTEEQDAALLSIAGSSKELMIAINKMVADETVIAEAITRL